MSAVSSDSVVWLDGTITDFRNAKVSAEDRGFMFADGVYEVIRVYGGNLFAAAEHMARLRSSAAGIELELPFPTQEIVAIADDVLSQSGLGEAEIATRNESLDVPVRRHFRNCRHRNRGGCNIPKRSHVGSRGTRDGNDRSGWQ